MPFKGCSSFICSMYEALLADLREQSMGSNKLTSDFITKKCEEVLIFDKAHASNGTRCKCGRQDVAYYNFTFVFQ